MFRTSRLAAWLLVGMIGIAFAPRFAEAQLSEPAAWSTQIRNHAPLLTRKLSAINIFSRHGCFLGNAIFCRAYLFLIPVSTATDIAREAFEKFSNGGFGF